MKKTAAVLLILFIMCSFSTCTAAGNDVSAADECLSEMIDAVVQGDSGAGLAAQAERDRIIKRTGSGEQLIQYAELDALSRFISSQAEGFRLTDELRQCVGEVALNRIASPDFSNDIMGVCLEFGVTEAEYEAIRPSRQCVYAALRLIEGQRLLSPEVFYISTERSEDAFATFYTRLRGYTYFLTE